MGGLGWQPFEDQRVRDLYPWADKATLKRCIKRHTIGAIKARASYLRVSRDRPSKDRNTHPAFRTLKALRRLRNEGRDKAAQRLGCNPDTLRQMEQGLMFPSWFMFQCWLECYDAEVIVIPRRRADRRQLRKAEQRAQDVRRRYQEVA